MIGTIVLAAGLAVPSIVDDQIVLPNFMDTGVIATDFDMIW
jgi:hypothetical protein